MKSIMKTIVRNTKLVMILAFLSALLSAAQAQAVDYQTKYKGTMYNVQSTASYGVSAPTMGFRSTSVLPTSGSAYTANPMIEGNGLVATPSASAPGRIGHIRRVDLNDNGIEDDLEEEEPGNGGTPGQTVDPEKQLPLGDVVWPLMLLLCAYAGYKKVRARKERLSQ